MSAANPGWPPFEADQIIERLAAEIAEPNYNRDPRAVAYFIDKLIRERVGEFKMIGMNGAPRNDDRPKLQEPA